MKIKNSSVVGSIMIMMLAMVLTSCHKDARKGTEVKSPKAENVKIEINKNNKKDKSSGDKVEDVEDKEDVVKKVEQLDMKCINPVSINDVPKTWKIVEGKELITGEKGLYELVQVNLHGVMQVQDEKPQSMTTLTLIKKDSDSLVEQKIVCNGVDAQADFNISAAPPEKISLEDGAYNARRNVMFNIKNNFVNNSAEIETINMKYFDVETEEEKAQEEVFKNNGGEANSIYYQISEDEFEWRMVVTIPIKDENSTLTLNAAFRYKLQK